MRMLFAWVWRCSTSHWSAGFAPEMTRLAWALATTVLRSWPAPAATRLEPGRTPCCSPWSSAGCAGRPAARSPQRPFGYEGRRRPGTARWSSPPGPGSAADTRRSAPPGRDGLSEPGLSLVSAFRSALMLVASRPNTSSCARKLLTNALTAWMRALSAWRRGLAQLLDQLLRLLQVLRRGVGALACSRRGSAGRTPARPARQWRSCRCGPAAESETPVARLGSWLADVADRAGQQALGDALAGERLQQRLRLAGAGVAQWPRP